MAGSLSSVLAPEAVVAHAPAITWEDALRAAGDALVRSGATTDEYTNEMIEAVRTLGPYIVIAPGIALAHARPSPAVLHVGVSIVTLAEPVEFGQPTNDPVDLVVGLAATDHDAHLEVMRGLAMLLSGPAAHHIRSAESAEQILDIVKHAA